MYSPGQGLPVLSLLMRLCMAERDNYNPSVTLKDMPRLQKAFAPWGSALEVRELGISSHWAKRGMTVNASTGAAQKDLRAALVASAWFRP